MHRFILFIRLTPMQDRRVRAVRTLFLTLMLLAPLLTVCGCHDVAGAASGTAGQMNERQNRDKEATEILDSGTKKP